MEIFEHDGWLVAKMVTGLFASNVYLIVPEGGVEAALIDAGGGVRKVPAYCNKNGLELKYIILTHRHWDHTMAARRLRRATGATVLTSSLDSKTKKPFSEGGCALEEGDRIALGNLSLKVISTPGHTPGGITLALDNSLFTGDTLFANGVGRTDLKGGDYQVLMNSLRRLFKFPDKTIVYPGHGPNTTIGKEKYLLNF